MNPEHLTSLKQAAELVKAGKTKSARGLIIEVLREDPNNAQAWYMLSFAVPRVDRQIYALQQTIQLVPDHQKAIDRLKKLGGNLPDPSNQLESIENNLEVGRAPTSQVSQSDKNTTEEDLLSRRLFGETPAENKSEKPQEEQPAKAPVFYHEIVEQAETEKHSQPDEYAEFLEEVPYPKILGIPRKHFLIGAGILLIGVIAIFIFSPRLIELMKNTSPAQRAGISTLETQLQFTETPLPSPTNTAIPPTPTALPTFTPIPFIMFSTSQLPTPSEDSMGQIELIESGIQSLLGIASGSEPEVFAISEPNLQTLVRDFSKFDGFEDQVRKNQKIFEILGLAQSGDDFSSFYQNLWVDPNGTLFLPEKDSIVIVGFEISEYQQFSFTQAYVQSIRNQQYSYASNNLFPPCLELLEECEVRLALAKGEAAFTALQWAVQNQGEEIADTIQQTFKKLYFVPVYTPAPIMEALRLFPYYQGYTFAEVVFEQDGWQSITNLYTNPPSTTEQILHPEKYFDGEVGATIDATDLSLILPEGYMPLFQDSLGEWKTYLVLTAGTNQFARLNEEEAQLASAGWNGDHTQVFTSSTGQNLVLAHWDFDTETDTAEFYAAFGKYAARRVVGETITINNFSCIKDATQVSCLIQKGSNIIWLLGSDIPTAEIVLEKYQFLETD